MYTKMSIKEVWINWLINILMKDYCKPNKVFSD